MKFIIFFLLYQNILKKNMYYEIISQQNMQTFFWMAHHVLWQNNKSEGSETNKILPYQ